MDIDSIGIGVETRQVKQASKDLDKLGSSADKASRKADDFSKANRNVESSSAGAAKSVARLAAAYISIQSLRALGGMVDTYTKFNAQLKIASRTQEDFAKSYEDVVRISSTAQSGIEGTATLYARLANTLKDTNVTQQQFADITESVALGLKVSGASAGETQSAMLQLSQAFASGVLRGEEFNAVSEASFPLMKALADSMKIPIEQLRSMAMEGLITRDELVKAFSDPKLIETFRTQAKEVQTLGGAVTNAKTEFLLFVGKVAEKTGIVDFFTVAINAGSGALREFNSLLTNGKIRLDSFLPAYDKYRQKMDEEAKKAGLTPKKFGFAGKIGDAITADEVAGIPSLGGILTASDPKKKADEIIKASGNASKAISNDAERLAREQQEFDLRMYQIEVDQAEAARAWKKQKDLEEEQEKKESLDRWMKYQQKKADENFKAAQEANEKFEQERRREAERTADIMSQSLADSIMRGFERGQSFAENFIDSLKRMFQTLILRPTIEFLVNSTGITKLLGSLGGIFASGSAQAAGGGSNSIMSALGGIKDVIGSLNGSLVSSIENLGVFLSTGSGGLGDAIGGFLGQYAGEISNVLPFAGAALNLLSGNTAGAIGSALGAALSFTPLGPVGGIVGSVLGSALGGMFGGKDYDRFGSEVRTQSNNGVIRDYMSGKIYDKDIGGQSQLSSLNSAFLSTFSDFTQSFGGSGNAAVGSGIFQRGKSGITGGLFNAYANGQEINLNVSLKDSNPSAVFQALAEKAMGEGLAKAIQSSDVQEGIKKFFNGLISSEDVTATIQTLTTLKASLQDLPDVFKAIQFEIDTTLFGSNAAQITSRFQALSNYTNLFYSDSEKFETAFKQLTSQFGALGQALPTTREGYRALIDGFEVFDEASANTFYGLLSLASSLDAFYGGINDINNALADGLNKNLYSTYADYVSAQATVSAGGDATGFMARINNPVAMNQVMAEEVKMLRESNAEMKVILSQIAFNTKKTKDIQREWNGDGLPTERTY